MKKIITSFLMAIMALGVWAADPEVVFDLTKQDNFNQCTQASLVYERTEAQPAWTFSMGSANMYQYRFSTSDKYDDYLITPALSLEGGCEYSVQITPSAYSNTYNNVPNLKIWIGQSDDLEQYDLMVLYEKLPNGYSAPSYEHKFVIKEDGNYKIAFEGYERSISLKQTKIVKYGVSSVPQVPSDFELSPNEDGELNVSISFTMPSQTLTYQDLEATTYTLYRGEDAIKEDVSATPGSKVEIVDEVSESGLYTYSLEINCGGVNSEKISAETFVGFDDATAPENVKFELVDGKYLVSWDAPTTGVNGTRLISERITYTVTRYLDGVATVLSDALKGITVYQDEFEFTNLHKLKYSVIAKYTNQENDYAITESEEILIGSVNPPFSDSFSSAEIDMVWTNTKITPSYESKSYYWQAVTEQKNIRYYNSETKETVYGDVYPYDEDGGMLMYSSYSNSKGYSARLASPPITYKKGENPVLTFARHINNTPSSDQLIIQVSVNYGEWVDVEGATFINGNAEENGWIEESVSLASSLTEEADIYQFAFLAVSNCDQYMFVDAIRIFNQIDKDLSIDAFTVSEKAHAGSDLKLMVKVSNNGVEEVAADQYSVEITHDFGEEIVISDLKSIPALGSAAYEVTLPVHSLHLYNVNEFNFVATVNYEDDQDLSNNESDSKSAQSSYSMGTGVEIVKSTYDEEGNYYLYWNAAKDLEYVPVNIVESFEDEAFEDDSTGPFNGWVTIDLDGKSGGTWYSASGSQFNLAKGVSTPGNTKDGKNVLCVTLESKIEQDDWIISPKLNCKEGSMMDLSFLFGVKSATSYGNDYKVEILYTTEEEYDMENPANAFTETHAVGDYSYTSYNPKVPQDNNMHRVEFPGIPAEAKYVALHFISKGNYTPAMWVDDIHLVENDPNPLLGYHVYSFEVGGRLNDELIDADATEFVFKPASVEEPEAAKHRAPALATGEPNVFVAAVYADGEAKAENVWNYADQSVTGIENVAVDAAKGEAEYFNLQGMKVSGDNLTPGIYIIRAGGTSQKVLVK